jgi:hypothetical protein
VQWRERHWTRLDSSATVWQPHPTTLLRIEIPLGALSEKSWIPKFDRCTMVGEAKDSDGPPSHRHPFTFPCQRSQCISPTKKKAEDWNPIGRLKRKKLDSEVGLMCNVGRGQGFGMAPVHRHPSTFLGQSPQCLSPTTNTC